MLLRGRNTVGYTPYPTEVTDAFVSEAAATGVDIFRIFDALNDVDADAPGDRRRPARPARAVAEVALCYTGDLLDPAEDLYTLDYYLRLAEQIVDAGAHILAIKDMAGLLRPAAAERSVDRAARAVRPAGAPAHPRHRRAASSPPCSPRVDAGVGRRRRRQRADGRAPPASRRRRPSSPPSPTPSATPASTSQAVLRPRAVLGGRAAASTRRSSRACPGPPAGSTSTRSPAVSCRTCASRRSRWAWPTTSS